MGVYSIYPLCMLYLCLLEYVLAQNSVGTVFQSNLIHEGNSAGFSLDADCVRSRQQTVM